MDSLLHFLLDEYTSEDVGNSSQTSLVEWAQIFDSALKREQYANIVTKRDYIDKVSKLKSLFDSSTEKVRPYADIIFQRQR
jgi:hypothetical protein